jgi:DNA topoisomerase-3
MTIILAEKPSVAASFASALGVPRKDGVYQNETYIVANCIGHLLRLFDPQDYDPKYQKWALDDLPFVPDPFRHKPSESTKQQLDLVAGLLKRRYDKLVIATDAGREGELIARLVFSHAGVSDFSNVFRFWTSSALTKEVILDAMTKLKPAADYDDLYHAGLYRQLADWLVGINFSRFFSIRLQGRFTFGRVQTPVLNLIVDRENTIKAFRKSYFFRLEVRSEFSGVTFVSFVIDAKANINFDDKATLEALLSAVSGTSIVQDVSIEQKTLFPPRLFDLTELQKKANTTFGYTAQHTLEVAQALYEKHKCLSYPRTASRYLSRVNYDFFIQCLDALNIPHGSIEAANKNIFNDEAMERNKEDHHALLLLAPLPQGAAEEEKNIFSLVLENMTVIVKKPHVYEQIVVRHTKDSLELIARGKKVLDPGWKDKTTDPDEEEEDEHKQVLPDLRQGDVIALSDPVITEHERTPPKSFTEAALLTAMKKYGLGTVATRDAIIEGLLKNEYLFRKGKNLLPAEKAFFFIDAIGRLGHDGLAKYLDAAATAEWEQLLEDDPKIFFSGMKEFIISTLQAVKRANLDVFQNTAGTCPLCGARVLIDKFSFRCEHHKDQGCLFSIGRVICGAAVTEADLKLLLAGKKTGLKTMKSKAGKDFKAFLALDKEFKVQFEFKTEDKGKKEKAK